MARTVSKGRSWIEINRAPVLTLWTAVVAERTGFKRAEALTLGRAVAGLNAYSKGRSLGIFKPSKAKVAATRKTLKTGKKIRVELLNRAVPATRTKQGIRAVSKGKPISPESVQEYLEARFGDGLGDARSTMTELAKAYSPSELAERAYGLYVEFRPLIPSGKKGWGAKGRLSLVKIRQMARQSK
jgi:hypothetical protein